MNKIDIEIEVNESLNTGPCQSFFTKSISLRNIEMLNYDSKKN